MFSFFLKPNVKRLVKERNLPGLVRALQYQKEPEVRRDAAQALGEMADPFMLEPLKAGFLHDAYPSVRNEAFYAICKIIDPKTIPVLTDALMDRDREVRRAAARALEKRGWKPSTPSERVAYFLNPANLMDLNVNSVRGQVVPLGSRAVDHLLDALRHPDSNLRMDAAFVLNQFCDIRAVEPLIACLEGEELADHRGYIAGYLARIGPPAVPALISALAHPKSDRVREGAAKALGAIGDTRAIEPLKALYEKWCDHPNIYISSGAAASAALKKMGFDPYSIRRSV